MISNGNRSEDLGHRLDFETECDPGSGGLRAYPLQLGA